MKHLILKRLKQNAVIKKQARLNILRRFKKLQAERNPIITGGAYHIQSTQSQNKQRVKVTKSLSIGFSWLRFQYSFPQLLPWLTL